MFLQLPIYNNTELLSLHELKRYLIFLNIKYLLSVICVLEGAQKLRTVCAPSRRQITLTINKDLKLNIAI